MLKYLMLRILGGCWVYFTCSCAWSSPSSTVAWTDALTGLRALIGSVVRKKTILNGDIQGRGCSRPRVKVSAVQFAVFKWAGNAEVLPVPPELVMFGCTQSSARVLQQKCPCHLCQAGQHRHSQQGLCSTAAAHTAPGDTAGPPLLLTLHLGQILCKQVPLFGENQLLSEHHAVMAHGEKWSHLCATKKLKWQSRSLFLVSAKIGFWLPVL